MANTNFISILGYLVGVAGAITIIFSKVKNENLKDLRARVEILEKERADYKELLTTEREQSKKQHIQNRESIARLEKEVEIYKDLQLSSIAETNRQILTTLQMSSKTLIKDTASAAKHVAEVSADLSKK